MGRKIMMNRAQELVVNGLAAEKAEVAKRFFENVYCDEQNGYEISLFALIEFNTEAKGLAGVIDTTTYQCLNELYVKNSDNLHLGGFSIGGVIKLPENPTTEQLVDVIDSYNNGCIFESGRIKQMILKDGTVIMPSEVVR